MKMRLLLMNMGSSWAMMIAGRMIVQNLTDIPFSRRSQGPIWEGDNLQSEDTILEVTNTMKTNYQPSTFNEREGNVEEK